MRFSIYSNTVLTLLVFVLSKSLGSCEGVKNNDDSRTQIALREVGNKLMLQAQDSTTVIPPVRRLDKTSYQLSFNSPLYIQPDSLVELVHTNLDRLSLATEYQVAVQECLQEEVVYSYQISQDEERTLIPCRGRDLPEACYEITLTYLGSSSASGSYILLGAVPIALVGLGLYFRKKKPTTSIKTGEAIALGNFHFYPRQNKLVREAIEIGLSNKECELLEILAETPNQVVKREELTKRVWEDNGVIVGRSLDTYISKLRKKLKDDVSLQIVNVHGVGYKLIWSDLS